MDVYCLHYAVLYKEHAYTRGRNYREQFPNEHNYTLYGYIAVAGCMFKFYCFSISYVL